MAITRVNVTSGDNWGGGAAATQAAAAAAHTTGNLLVVTVGAEAGAATVTGIADTAGNTYTRIDGLVEAAIYREELWYAKNITGHATNVVTVTWSTGVAYRGIAVVQYSGGDPTSPLDGTAKGTVASGTSVTTSTLTAAQSDTVHVLVARFGYHTIDTITWPAGFSANLAAATPNVQLSEKFVAAPFTGTYTITHSNAANPKIALVAAFAAPAGGGGGARSDPLVWLL